MHPYAQTNLQLYAQLRAAGWDDERLALAGRSYELAMRVCGSSIRPNGKPFLNHLVGTCSIVASWDAPTGEVVCGLVHSVYSHGLFLEDSHSGMTAVKRSAVRDVVGKECESAVADYTDLLWSASSIERWSDGSTEPTSRERGAIRVRLANELEDHLDLGMRFARKVRVDTRAGDCDARVALAERFVDVDLARELAAAIAANAEADVPDVLVRDAERSFRLGSDSPRSGTE